MGYQVFGGSCDGDLVPYQGETYRVPLGRSGGFAGCALGRSTLPLAGTQRIEVETYRLQRIYDRMLGTSELAYVIEPLT